MPLKLVAPGRRKDNRYYIVRGTVGGRRIEMSTQTADKGAAERFAADLSVRLLAQAQRERGPDAETLTFEEAAQRYIGWRNPSKADRLRIDKLILHMGGKVVARMVHADLVEAANALYAGKKNATKNRGVIKPAAAILHYAAENKWRDWLRVKLFKEPRPTTRAASRSVRKLLLANTEGKKRLLILWLFGQGTRITETLRIEWPQIDLRQATVKVWVSKTQEWKTFPLDDALVAALANEDQAKPLWPWSDRSSVYKWLWPLAKRLGVEFTPHMARHSVGTWLNESGAGLKTIMEALGHASASSSLRYQSAGIREVREAKRKMAKLKG